MENIILTGMLKEFSNRFDLIDRGIDVQFEHFSNYCLLKTDHYDSFDFEKISTGASIGVDGVAIVVGGVIVDEVDDVKDFTKTQFDVSFHFTQAKTSAKFDLGSFLKFTSIVRSFFQDDIDALPPELRNAFEIKSLIYERSAKLRQLPSVHLYYVYTGEFSVDAAPVLKSINAEIEALQRIKYKFGNVVGKVCDGKALAQLYRATKNDVSQTISFQRHTALPPIKGASAAYIGVVKCSDYVRALQKEGGELNKGLFFENVRDFLGENNPVNLDIATTIKTPEERDRFAVLNNGVTIVAGRVEPSGDLFRISKFQVVNGCQTSHVLYKNRNDLSDEMFITVKLIETSDIDLYGRIIATTNSQSQVTKEAFATIKPYHKTVEDFFSAMRGSGYNFYYERRPHQFDEQEDIHDNSIVSAPSLIKCFVSVVMEEPHKVHYYYGRLLEEYNRKNSSEIFAESDYPGLYFASNLIIAKTRSAIGRQTRLNAWLFQLGMLIKKQVAPDLAKGVALRDKKFLQLLGRIEDGFSDAFVRAVQVLDRAKLSNEQNRLPEATRALLEGLGGLKLKAVLQSPIANASRFKLADGRYVGTIKQVDTGAGGVVIEYGPFLVSASCESPQPKWLRIGVRVKFNVHGSAVQSFEAV
ncbi:MAG: AIPR family protein [Salinivirgaceae bacterium]|nr:AIPR family protein [Salinivirgaceae bacterium]